MSYAKRMIHFKSSKAFQGYVHTTLHTPIKSIHWISRRFKGENDFCTCSIWIITTSWGPGNHSMSPPGCRPPFLKPKLHKESKNGFKLIGFRSPMGVIFFKLLFWYQKLSKKLDILLIFEFYGNIYGQIRPVLKKLMSGRFESVEILPKC